VSKTTAQPHPTADQAGKKATPARSAARPAKTTTKSSAKAVAASDDEASAAPGATTPSAKATVNAQAPAPKPLAKATGRSTATPAAADGADANASTPMSSSRFTDRFAPPKPPTRSMSHLSEEIVKTPPKADPKLANAWKSKAGRDLTEPELLAMPEGEYMNDKQLDFFRAKLQALKDDLLSNAGETTEHLREDTSIVPDPADRATIEEEHALELRTRDREIGRAHV
jgi:DnaK suppressor protein